MKFKQKQYNYKKDIDVLLNSGADVILCSHCDGEGFTKNFLFKKTCKFCGGTNYDVLQMLNSVPRKIPCPDTHSKIKEFGVPFIYQGVESAYCESCGSLTPMEYYNLQIKTCENCISMGVFFMVNFIHRRTLQWN